VRVLAACSLGGAGHFEPLRPLLDAARARGDEVLVVAPPALREMVTGAGYPFEAGGEPAESAIAPIREQLPMLPAQDATVLGNRDLFGRLAAHAMLPRMDEVSARWRPDLVLRDPCEYASAVVAATRGIPAAQVAISLAENEMGSIRAAAPALEEHRAGLTDEIIASPFVTRFPASLEPSPFPTTIRYREPETVPVEPLPDWWDGSDAPLVYLTMGTVLAHMTHAAPVYRTMLRAVGGLPIRVLLTVGRFFDPAGLGPVPENTRAERWVDQARVFPHADVVVCHGGSGTLFGAVAAGVPVVSVPVFADQFGNARRVAEFGAGLVVEVEDSAGATRALIAEPDAPRITAAIETALAAPSYRERAQVLAAETSKAPTPDQVLARLAARS
jgi:UDP:flavonoid glycosyltransferase YjiC (YdhE family)